MVWDKAKGRYITGRCRLTRFLSATNANKSDSRPCGLMVAWLLSAEHLTTFEDHQNKFYIACTEWERRLFCRELLRKVPNGAILMSWERKKKDGEEEEPA